MSRFLIPLCFALGLPAAQALVNPSLQPADLYERHKLVLVTRVSAIDKATRQVTLAVEQVVKGTFEPKAVQLTLANESLDSAFFLLMGKKKTLVAYVGKARRANEMIFYLDGGDGGRWQQAELDPADPAHWVWNKDLDRDLFGTFNGSADRLAEMMTDHAAGRAWFPSVPFDGYGADRQLAKLTGPARGVAIHDLDGDGRPDLYACGDAGDQVWLQTQADVFTESGAALGLKACRSRSIACADLNGDSRCDMLLDDAIWLRGAEGTFTRSALLPTPAASSGKLICSALIDADADGWPDIVISRQDGGLALWRNPGPGGAAFTDVSAAAGLARPECGAGGSGWVACGDWNGDGRSDLFTSGGGGRMLINGGAAGFSALPLGYDFGATDGGGAQAGAACFAPVWKAEQLSLVCTRDAALCIVTAEAGKPIDQTVYGNELQISGDAQLPVIAEDLNADGLVDIYVGSRTGGANIPYMNRGYGSFMVSDRYASGAYPGTAHRSGAWGIAAGDVDGDGVPELLLGAADGRVTLMPNAVLKQRKLPEHPTAAQRILAGVRLVTVHIAGPRGVIGAHVVLRSADGRVLGKREIGAATATGCCGPNQVNFAVREHGKHQLTVRWSDGAERSWPVETTADSKQVTTLKAERPENSQPPKTQ